MDNKGHDSSMFHLCFIYGSSMIPLQAVGGHEFSPGRIGPHRAA